MSYLLVQVDNLDTFLVVCLIIFFKSSMFPNFFFEWQNIYIRKRNCTNTPKKPSKGATKKRDPQDKPPGATPYNHLKKQKTKAEEKKEKATPKTPKRPPKLPGHEAKGQIPKLPRRGETEAPTPTPKRTKANHHQNPTDTSTGRAAPPTHDKNRN